MAKTSGIKMFERLAYKALTNAHVKKREYDDAVLCGTEYLNLAQESGAKVDEMDAMSMIGYAHLKKQENDDAISYGKKYLAIAQECGDKGEKMKAYKILGAAHLEKEEYDDAILYTKKFLAMAQQTGQKEVEKDARLMLGYAHFKKQEYDDAISYGKKFLPTAQERGYKENEMRAYMLLANAHMERKKYDDSISYDKKCLAIAQKSGSKGVEMYAYLTLGYAHLKKQDYDDAISYCKKCLPIAQERGDKENEMKAYMLLANAHMERKKYDDAISYDKKCLAIAQESGSKEVEMKAYILLGNAYFSKQEYDDAISYGEKCLSIAQECGDKKSEMQAYILLGNAYLNKQEYDDAISYGKKCLPIAQECGDKEEEMNVYILLGISNLEKQEYDDAISYGKKCLPMARECGDKENEMRAYMLLGNAYLNKQEYDDAISYGEKCLPIAQERGDNDAEMKVYKLLGNAYLSKQEYDDAISYNKKCLAIAQESGSKEVEMCEYLTLGYAHLKKREHDDAISYGKKCLPMAQECGDKEREMKVYMMLGDAYLNKQECDDAISCGEKCLSLAQKWDDKDAEMKAYLMLGDAYLNKQEYDDAISCGEKCLSLAQKWNDKDAEMKAYLLLGDVYLNKQEYDAATAYYQNRLSSSEQCDDKMAEMTTYKMLGEAYLCKEEYGKAVLYSKNCLAIAQESGDKEKEAEAYRLLGEAHWKNNAYDDAYSCFTEGKKIAMDLPDDRIMSVLESYLNMIYGEVGIEIPSGFNADRFYAFLETLRFNPTTDSNDWATSYLRYNYHRKKYRYKKALSHLKEAEATLPTIQPRNNSLHCRKKMWICKQGIAEMYVQLGQHDEAMKYQQEALAVAFTKSQHAASHFSLGQLYYNPYMQLDEAKKSLEESLKRYELIFKDLKQNDRFKIAFVDKYKEVYKMLLKVLIETDKKEEALVLSDRYRAKALKDLLVSSYEMKKEPTAEETDYLLYADVQSLVSSRNYSLLFYSSCDEKLCMFLVQTGRELEFSVQHFEYCDKCLDKLVNKAYDDMKVMREVVNCEDQSLDVKDDSEENKNPKEDELTRMLTRQKEERLTKQCRSICGCRGNLSVKSDDATTNAQKMKHHKDDRCLVEEDENAVNPEGPSGLEILYNKLIDNIKCLFKKEEILIIPEGPLCKVPFAALQDPETGQYLSETKRIRMAPSMATLKFLQEDYPKEHTPAKEALVIGDPFVGQVMMTETAMKIKQLPGARKEANHIGSILGVQPLLGADATKTAVIKRLQEGASIVHIAAHGNLKKATILLAPAAPELRENEKIPVEEDYMLTMADVQQAQVRAQLVVLSCCYTGRGEIKAEGVVGLCRAFLASGARAVMGSLWAVHDDATMEFMKTFYKYLKDGKSASTSLHLTMNDMRKTPKYSKPMFWAPFFLMGDDVTVKF